MTGKVVMTGKIVLLAWSLAYAGFAWAQTSRPAPALVTNKVYVGVEGTAFANFSTFSGSNYVDNGMRKPPLLTRSFGLSLRQNLSQRLSLETGGSIIRLGYKATFTGNYRGGRRWRDKATVTSAFSLLEIPLRINYFVGSKATKWRKYVSLGTSFLYNPNAGLTGAVGGKAGFVDAYTGDTFTLTERRWQGPRLTAIALAGIGIERDLGRRVIANLGLVYAKGFTNVAVWEVRYTTWDVSQAVDGVAFNNTITNKSTYLGLRLAFQVALF
jgi:hypothetical protein